MSYEHERWMERLKRDERDKIIDLYLHENDCLDINLIDYERYIVNKYIEDCETSISMAERNIEEKKTEIISYKKDIKEKEKIFKDISIKIKLMSKKSFIDSFKMVFRMKKVLCVRAILLENSGNLMTADEISDLAREKYNVNVYNSDVTSECRNHKDEYDCYHCYPFRYSIKIESFNTVWHKVFLDEWKKYV